MKNKVAGLLTIVTILAVPCLAQGWGPPGGPDSRGNQLNFLTTMLSLTDAQKQEATSIFNTAEQASSPLHESLRQQHQALGEAVKSNASDAQIDQLANALGDLTGQLAAIRTKSMAKFYALLTDEQREKFNALHEKGRGFGGGPSGGRGPGAKKPSTSK